MEALEVSEDTREDAIDIWQEWEKVHRDIGAVMADNVLA